MDSGTIFKAKAREVVQLQAELKELKIAQEEALNRYNAVMKEMQNMVAAEMEAAKSVRKLKECDKEGQHKVQNKNDKEVERVQEEEKLKATVEKSTHAVNGVSNWEIPSPIPMARGRGRGRSRNRNDHIEGPGSDHILRLTAEMQKKAPK